MKDRKFIFSPWEFLKMETKGQIPDGVTGVDIENVRKQDFLVYGSSESLAKYVKEYLPETQGVL